MRSALDKLRTVRAAVSDDEPDTRHSHSSEAVPINKMRIADFARSGRVIRITSSVLGCDVILAADNADACDLQGIAVFRAREFKHLHHVTAEELRLIHAVKLSFDGEFVDDGGDDT